MMPENPLISIVMPLYNKEAEVKRAIQSVLAQSFPDYELIVIDDGSTDKGPDVVSAIEDSRIRMLHQKNAGVSAARNRGTRRSEGGPYSFSGC
jgi:glycosyltransferase involved in cell wall biosynthesis